METKFTKGPWIAAIDGDDDSIGEYLVADTNGKNICELTLRDDDEANAQLIGAAPEMFEAMQEFCDRVDRGEVRSKKTYEKFKAILTKITQS